MDKIQSKQNITKLIEKYQRLAESGKIKDFNEAQTVNEFILPLFFFLGWDIHNINADEVTPEETISRGRVDWAFRIDGIPKFFLEAKAMKVDLDVAKWAEQAINYAWNKGCTWAVLTDFEAVKVFNADVSTKNLKESLFFEIPANEYLSRFDQLWLLSKEAFKEGLLDKEAEKWGKKVKRTPVGERLFQDMMEWRMLLTKGFHKANTLTPDELDEGVQRVLDRLVFIRVTEDRGIEPNILLSMLRQSKVATDFSLRKNLAKIFRDFDEGYNSKLFTHHSSENWQIDNETLEMVINSLYETGDGYRYDFSAISADVLGGIYEQYLGHILKQATKRASVKKEHKKRKEQGIYYTPQFVVDYIVKNTIGRLLSDKSYREVIDLKVLDPACGSGSFLIRAYDELVNYFEKKDKQANLFTKFRILTANIYGVDLDAQAVEIAQLNLLLKTLSTKAKLPNLAGKIRIGNSLISDNSPHPQGEREQPVAAGFSLREYFGDNFHEKKPFTYEKEFPEVFNRKNPGFDVIIGNPPYVRIQTLPKDEVRYFSDKFESARGSYDIYLLFIERALSLLRNGGVAGFILPNKFMVSDYGEGLRKLLSSEQAVWKIVDFGDAQVFEGATTYTMLLFLQKTQNKEVIYVSASDYLKQKHKPNLDELEAHFVKISSDKLTAKPWSFATSKHRSLLEKIEEGKVRFGEFTERMFQGLVTSADKIYILHRTEESRHDKLITLYLHALEKSVKLEKEIVHPLLKGSLDMRRYYTEKITRYVLFPYKNGTIIPQEDFEKHYPHCWQYLMENRATLSNREKGKMKHTGWYGYVYPKSLTLFEK
ncbi:MAG: N-6 DNA methylase, partial [Nitrospinae bacterium]|nr:N-6 DNA methylase [Nitrospinota bacterium]